MRPCAALLWSMLVSATLVHGQEFRATLTGRVLDAGGAPVPNARHPFPIRVLIGKPS
jgi:hypothetical protein